LFPIERFKPFASTLNPEKRGFSAREEFDMGLSDRDYMQRQHVEVFDNKKSSQNHRFRSTLWTVLIWLTALFLLYKSFLWLESYKQSRKELNPGIELRAPEKAPLTNSRNLVPSPGGRSQPDSSTGSEASNPDTRTVTKCLLNGHVIFTDGKCPSGSSNSTVTVNTAKVGTVAPPAFVSAPPQVQQPAVRPQAAVETSNAATVHEAECNLLKQEIDQIDALTRQPLSGRYQDDLRARREKVRSKQFALHC
jgi:hypothetical protein